jgi:signal transduction histidine kinase
LKRRLDQLALASINCALERLKESAVRQKRFLGSAAHELMTPVAILEPRLDHFDTPTVKNDLRRDARKIRVLVEQLLASARLSRTDRAKTETVDLIGICQAVVDDFALLTVRQGKEIEFQGKADRCETPGDTHGLRAPSEVEEWEV